MGIRRVMPRPELRGIVRSFGEQQTDFGNVAVTWTIPARPHQILDIYLAEPWKAQIDGGSLKTSPQTVLVGPQSRSCFRLHMSGRIHVFNILFQPAALHRLVGIDMTSLVNQDPAAADVLGTRALLLRDAVLSAPDFASRVAVAERCLGAMLDGRPPADGIDRASRLLVATRGAARIDALAEEANLGPRQFQRQFARQVGLSPKLYARTVRFEAALTARRNAPAKRWTDIVHEAGYFDQAHFVRECRALTGVPPGHFIDDWESSFFLSHD
jgi:AraC-like DNA-binding protein